MIDMIIAIIRKKSSLIFIFIKAWRHVIGMMKVRESQDTRWEGGREGGREEDAHLETKVLEVAVRVLDKDSKLLDTELYRGGHSQ